MRSATSGELALLQTATGYNVYARVWVANADGTWKDLANLSGLCFFEDLEIDIDIDQPIAECTVRCKRDIGALSLAPFREDSTLNRRDDGVTYANLVDPGRDFFVETACVALGGTPASGNWKEVFRGIIDTVNAESEPLVFKARDLGAYIADAWFAEATTHTYTGTPIETVLQQVLQEGGMDGRVTTVTLYTPSSPGFAITSFGYDREPVLDAAVRLAQVIGWDVRYVWDSGTSSWRFTLRDPQRTKTTPDCTFGPSQYIDITNLAIDRTNVRNSVIIKWGPASGRLGKLYEDGVSISRFKKRSVVIEEASDSPIDTEAEADALGAAVLADLADPKAEQSVEMLYFWPAELGDLYRFSPNAVHYSVNEDLAVVRIRHAIGRSGSASGGVQHRTVLDVRGKPSGGYLNWIARAAKGKPPEPNPTGLSGLAMRIHQRDASDESVELDVYVADSSPDPAKPITVQARGFGVGSVLGDDGTQSAIVGLRGNLVSQSRNLTLSPWTNRSFASVIFDTTVAGPDGKLGVSRLVSSASGQYTGVLLSTADFNGVAMSVRVWVKAAAAMTARIGLLWASDASAVFHDLAVTTEWQMFDVPLTPNSSTAGTFSTYLQVFAAGTLYVWGVATVRGTFAAVTADLDTTDYAKFVVSRADMQTTATNLVRGNDALDANNWINGGSVVITPNVATYAGHSFSRLAQTNPASAAYIQNLTGIDTDGVYTASGWYHHDGHTGRDVHVFWDATANVPNAEWFVDYNADGSITLTPSTGILTATQESDGVVRVDVVSGPVTAAHLNQLYACDISGGGLGAGGVTSQLQSGWMIVKGASPFPQPITTTTQAVTRTVDNAAGAVAITALREGTAQVSQTIVVPPRGTLPASAAQFVLEGEATSRDGNGDGQVRLIATFDGRTESMNIYASESATSAGATPASDQTAFSGSIARHEGVIASDENWTTEYDIATTPGWYRQIAVGLVQPGGGGKNLQFRLPLFKYFEQLAADVGTGPASAPTSTVVTFSTVNGVPRATVSFAGDPASSHRILRNGYWLTRLPPGSSSFVDDGLTVGTDYKYRVQAVKNGQTSDFDGGGGVGGGGSSGGTGGGTSSGTAQTPSWSSGYPFGGSSPFSTGNPSYVNVRVVNPDPLASTEVWMSPTNADAGPWIKVGDIGPGSVSLTIYGDDFGVSYGETRYFFLVATRPDWSPSGSSAHKSAGFFGDP